MPLESSFTFRRDVREVGHVSGFIRLFAREHAIDPDAQFAVDLAVEELITNMIKYNPDGSPEIAIGLEKSDGRLIVTLCETDSPEFDPTERTAVDVTASLADRTPGGLGLHLVHRVVDEIYYEHERRRNTIRLVKHLQCDHA